MKSKIKSRNSERGGSLVSALIAMSVLMSLVYVYTSAAKETYQLGSEVDTKNMYSKLYTILSGELLDQISNFIFGPLDCSKVGSPSDAGDVGGVPSFMADDFFRPAGEERIISGFKLSRDEDEFKSGPSGKTFVTPSTTLIGSTLIPNLRYRNAFDFCKNNLNETISVSTSSFQFCVYFLPVATDQEIHEYLPLFAIVTVDYWDFNNNTSTTCSDFDTRAQSLDRTTRQAVGAKIRFELHWASKSGATYGYYSGNYLLTVPKDHILFKSSKCYRPITASGSTRGWEINATRSDCNNGSFDVVSTATNLSGIDGADRLCQDAANAIGLSNRFKAMMSTSTESVRDRLRIAGRIFTLSGTLVANSATELWMANNATGGPIIYDETVDDYGESDALVRRAWAGNSTYGKKSSGTAAASFCNDWRSQAGSTTRSVARGAGTQIFYDNGGTVNCNQFYYFICISQD